MKRKLLIVLLFSCCFSVTSVEQARPRYPIWINAKTDDDVGKSLLYELREEVARSPLYSLADSEESAGLQLSVVSLSEGGSDVNNASAAVSVVLLLRLSGTCDYGFPLYLDHWTMTVGRDRTQQMARRLVAGIDGDVETIRRLER